MSCETLMVILVLWIYMGHWEQDGINLNSMVMIFFRSRVDTDIVLHQSGWGKVFLAYQGFGLEEREKQSQNLGYKYSV